MDSILHDALWLGQPCHLIPKPYWQRRNAFSKTRNCLGWSKTIRPAHAECNFRRICSGFGEWFEKCHRISEDSFMQNSWEWISVENSPIVFRKFRKPPVSDVWDSKYVVHRSSGKGPTYHSLSVALLRSCTLCLLKQVRELTTIPSDFCPS